MREDVIALNIKITIRRTAAKKKPPPRTGLKTAKEFLYRDPKYGFSLKIPRWWKCYTVVETSSRLTDAEYGVFFLFKYKGKTYGDALSVLVYKMTLKQWRDQGYDESPFIFLARQRGRIFACNVPGELPGEFLNKDKSDYDYKKYGRPIRLLKRMVNDDVPKIVKTFRLKKPSAR